MSKKDKKRNTITFSDAQNATTHSENTAKRFDFQPNCDESKHSIRGPLDKYI